MTRQPKCGLREGRGNVERVSGRGLARVPVSERGRVDPGCVRSDHVVPGSTEYGNKSSVPLRIDLPVFRPMTLQTLGNCLGRPAGVVETSDSTKHCQVQRQVLVQHVRSSFNMSGPRPTRRHEVATSGRRERGREDYGSGVSEGPEGP